jgi:hypothetical protein
MPECIPSQRAVLTRAGHFLNGSEPCCASTEGLRLGLGMTRSVLNGLCLSDGPSMLGRSETNKFDMFVFPNKFGFLTKKILFNIIKFE